MAEFIIESDLKEEELIILQNALSEVATSDMPLVLELLFVSQEEIRALNARERGVDRVTDVLSFPAMDLERGAPIYAEEHGECVEPIAYEENGVLVESERLYLGSVVICKERAKEQAEEYGHSLEREIGYLTVHGALHCLGYDHETEEERAQMREIEERVMQKLGLRRDI